MNEPNSTWDIHADHESAITAAQSLKTVLRSRAAAAETNRTISEQTIADIREKGLFHLLAPRAFGGSELGIATFIESVAAVSSGCGSSGWVYAVLAGHNWTLSLLPLRAQQEVYGDPNALVASVIHLSSEPAVRVDGGYLIEQAQGRFCSGVDHAKWILAGAPTVVEEGLTQPHYFLIPRTDFVVEDDWYAVGLCGTGSKSVSAERIFVPDHRVCALAAAENGTAPGIAHHRSPLYRVPFRPMQRLQLLGVPVGIAREAIRFCTDAYRKHHGAPGRDRLEDGRSAFTRLARASVRFDAAVSLVMNDAHTLESQADTAEFSALERARCLRNIAYAAQECRQIVTELFEASGARGLLGDNALQRIWRDANAAAAHVAFARDKVDLPFGRAVCGLDG